MNDSLNKIIGENLRTIRELKKKKAREIAKELDITESAYTKYERGESTINPTRAFQLADILGVSPKEILLPLENCHIENSFHNSPINGTLNGIINNSTVNPSEIISTLVKIIDQNNKTNTLINNSLLELHKIINTIIGK